MKITQVKACVIFYVVRLKATPFLGSFAYTETMKTVYVDEMFLLNLVINYFILLATAKLCALPIRRLRFGLSAGLGALFSVSLLYEPLQFLASPVTKLLLGFVMSLVAFGAESGMVKRFCAFLALSAAFGGAVYGATLLVGSGFEDGFFVSISMRVLLLSFAACYFLLTLLFRRLGARQSRTLVTVSLQLCGKTTEFMALCDTGNELWDPISNLPVMVMDGQAAGKLLSEGLLSALGRGVGDFMLAVEADPPYSRRFRLVPYSAVGRDFSLLPVFRPDHLSLDGRETKDILVGISPTKLCGNGEFAAVVQPESRW